MGRLSISYSAALNSESYAILNHVFLKPRSVMHDEGHTSSIEDELRIRGGSSIHGAVEVRCSSFSQWVSADCDKFTPTVLTQSDLDSLLIDYLSGVLRANRATEPDFVRSDCPADFDAAMKEAEAWGQWQGMGWMKDTYPVKNASAYGQHSVVFARVKSRFLDRFERQYGIESYKVSTHTKYRLFSPF